MEEISLTPQEVAEKLKIAKNTVYELIKRGELTAFRVGRKVRVAPKDVEEYINKGKGEATTKTDKPESLCEYSPNSSSKNIASTESKFVICGQDIILDVLVSHLERHPNGTRALRSYVGSYAGLYALYNGDVQVATAHLWDGDSGEYNIPYVRRMLPGTSSIIVNLASRVQGFYVSKGNPKKINTWKDLMNPNVVLINREKGSGTRVLLDEHFRNLNYPVWNIKGYYHEEYSHLAVASSVARGEADVGIGIEKVALQVNNIDFIPLQTERYDLVIKTEDMNKPHFKAVLDILNSKEFKSEIKGVGGYNIEETGKIIANI